MKNSKLSDELIAYARRPAESGTAIADWCRQRWFNEWTL